MLRTAASTLLFFVASNSYAQIVKAEKPTLPKLVSASAPNRTEADETAIFTMKLRNEKMQKRFSRTFQGASNISLHPFERTTAITFEEQGVRHNVLYTNQGQWLHTVKYYPASQLRSDVASIIEAEFPEYRMSNVAEVITNRGTAHLVDIDSPALFKTIRVVDGTWDVYKEYVKSLQQ